MNELRTAKNGTQFFRASYFFKENLHFIEFGEALHSIITNEKPSKKDQNLIEKNIPDLIWWLWADFAKLPQRSFYCLHPYEKYEEEFNLHGLQFDDYFNGAARDFFRNYVGIPMWAEMSIDYVNTENEFYELRARGDYGLDSFLHGEGSSLGLLYAAELAGDKDLQFDSKFKPLDKFIIQSDPNWYRDQNTYYNWLDFDVSVDMGELQREEALVGNSYSSLSDKEQLLLVDAVIKILKNADLESQKIPQYVLTLLLDHPKTSDASKTKINLLGDEDIIEIDDED